jgi:hypothetical protein
MRLLRSVALALAFLSLCAGEPAARPRFALCLTGQLSRLEVATKVSRIVEPNLARGVDVDLFMYLDKPRPGRPPRQSRPKLQLGTELYTGFSADQLQQFVMENTRSTGAGRFRCEARLHSSPEPYRFVKYGDKEPLFPLDDDLTADERFQLNFAMLAQLRSCMQMVGAAEVRDRAHYDYVVRLRDDSVVFDDWHLRPELFGESITDVKEASWGAINDHTYVVSRQYADAMFRGPVEDYYLQNSVTKPVFGTSEVMLLHVSLAHKVPLNIVPVCDMPLVPLRGMLNATHWRLHPMYASLFLDGVRAGNRTCATSMLEAGSTPLAYPDSDALVFLQRSGR